MTALLMLVKHYYVWHRAIALSSTTGSTLLGAALLGALALDTNNIQTYGIIVTTAAIGTTLCIGVPVFFAPRGLIELVDSRHFQFIPRFFIWTGVAALLFIALVSLSSALVISLNSGASGNEFVAFALGFFAFLTTYLFSSCWAIRSRLLPGFVITFVGLFSLAAVYLPVIRDGGGLPPPVSYLILLATGMLWAIAFFRLHRHVPSNGRTPDHAAIARKWTNRAIQAIANLSAETALLGYPVTWGERLRILSTTILIVPCVIAVLSTASIVLMKSLSPGLNIELGAGEAFWITFMLGNAANTSIAGNCAGMATRSRALWLRGYDRQSTWTLLEKVMIAGLLCSAVLLATVWLLADISGLEGWYFWVLTMCLTAAWSYLSLATRLSQSWRALALPGLILSGVLFYAVWLANPVLIWICTASYLPLAAYYRYRARTEFHTVNWQINRPSLRELDKRSLISLW
ncbi:MAG: hypothetical protein GKR90_25115 [Pseudomonadales bacterium]|nr:hypothetical protein [Pseudomonadales bacterium]